MKVYVLWQSYDGMITEVFDSRDTAALKVVDIIGHVERKYDSSYLIAIYEGIELDAVPGDHGIQFEARGGA